MLLLIYILALILIFFICKIYKYHRDRILQSQVAWCVTKDSSFYRRNLSLADYIHNIQVNNNIDKTYRIIEEKERQLACEILESYQEDLGQKFFSHRLTNLTKKEISKMTYEDFFIFTLLDFLRDNLCKTEFNEKRMYDVKDYKSHGCYGAELFEATYLLNDYSLVYNKILLATEIYCERNEY